MIETYAYARAGLLGNPSDGYFGKTIALIVRNFRARVLLYPSARLEIKPSKADMPILESLDDLYATTRWRGYYGGIRIIQALLVRFIDYCQEQGIELENRNFTLEYESTIPLRLGLGGSSSIITAACVRSASTTALKSRRRSRPSSYWKRKRGNSASRPGRRTVSSRCTRGSCT